MTPSRFTSLRRAPASAASLATVAAIAATALTGCGSGSSHTTSSAVKTTTSASTSTSTPVAYHGSTGFTSEVFASGVPVTHAAPGGRVALTQPDDITNVGSRIFVGFQNGVGPMGEPTPTGSQGAGNRNSTVVEFSASGAPAAQWDIAGHVDGLTADPATGKLVATTNEDGKAHLYVIDPASPQAVPYTVPPLAQHGGFDAVSFWHGMTLISASAPGSTSGKAAPQASYPAVYVVTLNSNTHTVGVRSLFADEASANRANSGHTGTVHLALTDPDSNFAVPTDASRFGGQFELTSQGDYLQIFVADTGGHQLSVLKNPVSIDDSAWASGPSGTLYVTDGSVDLIYKITGPFQKGAEIAGVTPCNANNAPTSCPAPGFSSNYLGLVDQSTGAVSKLDAGTDISPAGLLFTP